MSLSNKLAVPQAQSSKDPWVLARRRARTYLSLQDLSEVTCEQILQQALHYLPSKPPKAEAEQIRAFLQSVQKATQLLLGGAYSTQLVNSVNMGRFANWTARKTGPRVERSSIKVAPLQAISLRLKPVQATTSRN